MLSDFKWVFCVASTGDLSVSCLNQVYSAVFVQLLVKAFRMSSSFSLRRSTIVLWGTLLDHVKGIKLNLYSLVNSGSLKILIRFRRGGLEGAILFQYDFRYHF